MASALRLTRATPHQAPILGEVHAEAFARAWSSAEIISLMNSPGVFVLTADEGPADQVPPVRLIPAPVERDPPFLSSCEAGGGDHRRSSGDGEGGSSSTRRRRRAAPSTTFGGPPPPPRRGGEDVRASVLPQAGITLGFVMARALAGEAEIITLAVRPAARRFGVGRALLEAAALAAQAAAASAIWLEVATDNVEAIGLYVSAGFAATGRRANYYTSEGGARVDALMMRRELNTATS